jgi:hypothetical protein
MKNEFCTYDRSLRSLLAGFMAKYTFDTNKIYMKMIFLIKLLDEITILIIKKII